jgi:hypothetical protein
VVVLCLVGLDHVGIEKAILKLLGTLLLLMKRNFRLLLQIFLQKLVKVMVCQILSLLEVWL